MKIKPISILLLSAFLSCQNPFLPPIVPSNTNQEVTDETGETVQRNDLSSSVYFESYKAGDPFSFSGTIQNVTKNYITMDNNIDHSCLEYRIMREGVEYFTINPADHQFSITLFEQGIIKAQHRHDTLTSVFSNIKARIDGKDYYAISPIEFQYSMPLPQPILKDAGTYWLDVFVRYQMDGEYYTAKFTSDSFGVGE